MSWIKISHYRLFTDRIVHYIVKPAKENPNDRTSKIQPHLLITYYNGFDIDEFRIYYHYKECTERLDEIFNIERSNHAATRKSIQKTNS